MLRSLRAELRHAIFHSTFDDDQLFQRLVREGLAATGTPDADFAELVNVSRSTVSRWKIGEAFPHPYLWDAVFVLLLQRVCECIEGEENVDPKAVIRPGDLVRRTKKRIGVTIRRCSDDSRRWQVLSCGNQCSLLRWYDFLLERV